MTTVTFRDQNFHTRDDAPSFFSPYVPKNLDKRNYSLN